MGATKCAQEHQMIINDLEGKQMEATERFQQYKVKNEEAANLLTLKIKELEAEKLDAIQNLDRYKAKIQEQEETNQSAKDDTTNIYKIRKKSRNWKMLSYRLTVSFLP